MSHPNRYIRIRQDSVVNYRVVRVGVLLGYGLVGRILMETGSLHQFAGHP